jgi:hypothetical protein
MGITFFKIISISKKTFLKNRKDKNDEMIYEIRPITEIHDHRRP